MKVYEKINQLKGTNSTKEQIADWSYMNKICPIQFDEVELELDCKYPKELTKIAHKCCESWDCTMNCINNFLGSEV